MIFVQSLFACIPIFHRCHNTCLTLAPLFALGPNLYFLGFYAKRMLVLRPTKQTDILSSASVTSALPDFCILEQLRSKEDIPQFRRFSSWFSFVSRQPEVNYESKHTESEDDDKADTCRRWKYLTNALANRFPVWICEEPRLTPPIAGTRLL